MGDSISLSATSQKLAELMSRLVAVLSPAKADLE